MMVIIGLQSKEEEYGCPHSCFLAIAKNFGCGWRSSQVFDLTISSA